MPARCRLGPSGSCPGVARLSRHRWSIAPPSSSPFCRNVVRAGGWEEGKIADSATPATVVVGGVAQTAITGPKSRQTGHDADHDCPFGKTTLISERDFPKPRIMHPA